MSSHHQNSNHRGQPLQQDSTSQFGSRSLKGYIFNFLATPFKVVSNLTRPISTSSPTQSFPPPSPISQPSTPHHSSIPLNPTTTTPNDSPNQALSKFFAQKGDSPLTEIEARGVMALLQESKTPEGSVIMENDHQELDSNPDHLPSAFTPNFRSLARPTARLAFPPRPSPSSSSIGIQKNGSSLLFSNPSPSPSQNQSGSELPPRRTFYMGPGHSVLNNSTRLSLARRKRLGRSSIKLLGNGYDVLPQPEPLEPNDRHHQPEKRRKLSDSDPFDHSSQHEMEYSQDHQQQQQITGEPTSPSSSGYLHQNLKLFKTASATPIRPSPLRTVTLAAGTPSPSPPKRIYPKTPTHLLTPITPTSNNNRAKRKSQSSIASTIIKSAVQQVDADLIRKSPVRLSSFEVKKSDVINPYANLERTRQPIQRKVKEVLKSASSENHRQERKRKLEIHTGRNEVMMGGNEPTVVIPVQMDVEELLERTMPDEYRREGGTEAGSKKKKKRQIGQLSDRLIKKQEAAAALESQKNRQTPPANSLGSKPKRPTASSSAATATNDEGVRPVAPLTSKFGSQVPISSFSTSNSKPHQEKEKIPTNKTTTAPSDISQEKTVKLPKTLSSSKPSNDFSVVTPPMSGSSPGLKNQKTNEDKSVGAAKVSSVVGSNHGLGALSVVGGRSVTSGGSNDVNPFSGSSSTSLFSKTAEKVKVNGEEKISEEEEVKRKVMEMKEEEMMKYGLKEDQIRSCILQLIDRTDEDEGKEIRQVVLGFGRNELPRFELL